MPKSRNFMRLSREEFWVLDTTIQWDSQLPLPYLDRRDATRFFNKRKHHGLSTNDLIDRILFMQKQGDLVLFRQTDDMFPEWKLEYPSRSPGVRIIQDFASVWENQMFYSKAAIIKDFLLHEEYEKRNSSVPFHERERYPQEILMYCASVQSAEKWAETAHVDWNKFLGDNGFDLRLNMEDTDLSEDQSLVLRRVGALSEKTLDAWFDWRIRWDAHPDSFETSCFKRYHTERVLPWKATYWKTFPEGYECDYLEYTVHRSDGMNKEESNRHSVFHKQSWEEHHALFDWCNLYSSSQKICNTTSEVDASQEFGVRGHGL